MQEPVFRKFPKIGQFRNFVKDATQSILYRGKDKEGNAQYADRSELPVVRASGTVKLHGTNAAIGYNFTQSQFWTQSRNNIITPENDNCGFSRWAHNHKDVLIELLGKLYWNIPNQQELEPRHNTTIMLYGEWAGEGIQKKVGISQLSKSFYVFEMVVHLSDGTTHRVPLSTYDAQTTFHAFQDNFKIGIYNIHAFAQYRAAIDLKDPQSAQNTLVELTQQVEKRCPVASYFLRDTENLVGEGIVWTVDYDGHHFKFKVKGNEHTASRVKTLASVDPEVLKSREEFIAATVTENRLKQAVSEVFTMRGVEPDVKELGLYIKWVAKDILEEEKDTLEASGLEWKDVASQVNNKVRAHFFKEVI